MSVAYGSLEMMKNGDASFNASAEVAAMSNAP